MAKPDLSLVRPLPRRVSHKPHETAFSLLCRLAVCNGSKSVKHMLQRVPNMSGFVSNLSRELEVSLAALLSGSNRKKIAKSTPLRLGRWQLGNYQGKAHARKFKICPLCIAEDTNSVKISEPPHVRDFWHFEDVIHCPYHRVMMEALCNGCQSEFSCITLFGCHCICGADVREICHQFTQLSEMTESWKIFREMGRMPDVPYWSLHKEKYPSDINWATTVTSESEYSGRQLMLLGPMILKPKLNTKAIWTVDYFNLLEAVSKQYRENPGAWTNQGNASRFLLEDS